MIYFAYGSNMSLARLTQRARGARRIACGLIEAHDLRFHKVSPDGSSKCDAFYTGEPDDCVHGCVFELSPHEELILDEVEGLGRGYEKKTVPVLCVDGAVIHAQTYYATLIDPALTPYDWYLNHVLVGARELLLPDSYLARIESVPSRIDPDRERSLRQWSVHNNSNANLA
ncbi:MAG: gamma-glutamylcyclotransferase [Oceanospirillaceae bacterium]|nr:gamma-glutamylcyclotransferase [Oceanospirillaceae bacterium]